jgi:hypothetical protein
MKNVPSQIEKEYPSRGPLHQFRFKEATAFHCFRCGTSKKSKLITIYNDDWSRQLCNGCYGRLLSIYDVKIGTRTDDEKAVALAELLLSLFNRDQVRESERLFRLSEQRGRYLTERAVKFVATAEHLSRVLEEVVNLDWSPATIGLCKAFEFEIGERLVKPLAQAVSSLDLSADLQDKDLTRVAKFCKNPAAHPPELGTFAHFLHAAITSEHRRASSTLTKAFLQISSSWAMPTWILDPSGLYTALLKLTRQFRNRAAHTEELTREDYNNCRDFVIGEAGILWHLLRATQQHK